MSSPAPTEVRVTHFEGASPILRVNDLRASIDYYRNVLGFKLDWEMPYVVSLGRDRCHIMLAEGDQGHTGGWVWIGVGDAGALFEEYTAKGAKIRLAPTNFQWAYEMQVEDLDGNVLRMGSDSKQDEPIGAWLDMNGMRWESQPDGGWKRA